MHIVAGGGIRTPQQARSLVDAGAHLIVTGTVVENKSVRKLRNIIRAIS
jgi:heptaprenylglyceryl phosphate synthase